MRQAHEQGITGEGVPVAVIDRGIDPGLPVLADAHLTVREPSLCMDTEWYAEWKQVATTGVRYLVPDLPAAYAGKNEATWQGTNTVAWLVGNGAAPEGKASVPGIAPGADVRFYATDNAAQAPAASPVVDCTGVAEEAQAMAIVKAVDDSARIVALRPPTISGPDARIAAAVAYALHEDVIIVVPGGGDSTWLSGLNGVIAVEATFEDGRPHSTVGQDRDVTVTAPGSAVAQGGDVWDRYGWEAGPQVAATLVAGILADAAQKWPEATNNQLIQSLIRNTEPGDHELAHDSVAGYGAVDLIRLLEVDPAGYEDVNPMIVPDDGQELGLTERDIRDAHRPVWSDLAPEPTAATAPSYPEPPPIPFWQWGSVQKSVPVLVLVVLAAALVLIRVVRTRAQARHAGSTDEQDEKQSRKAGRGSR